MMQTTTRRIGTSLALAAWMPLLISLPFTTHAQTPQVIQQFAKGPYTTTIENALVGIEVINLDKEHKKLETRHGNGFLIRADGFVLVPAVLFSKTLTGTQTVTPYQAVTIFLNPGTAKEQRIPGRRPTYFGTERPENDTMVPLGYAMLKLDNVCLPALRTLLPDTLQPGDEVEAVWSHWDEKAGHFTPLQRQKVQIDVPPKIPDKHHPGFLGFTEALKSVPAGAAVMGPEGMGIGLIPGASASVEGKGFISFQVLWEATNCVSPVPTPDALFAKQEKKEREEGSVGEAANPAPDAVGKADAPAEAEETGAQKSATGAPTEVGQGVAAGGGAGADKAEAGKTEAPVNLNEMVAIPGGPVRIPHNLWVLQRDMEGASVACVAPFKIDRSKVSNKDYLAFWSSIPESERQKPEVIAALYPWGWGPSGNPFPPSIRNYPVIGVPLTGAALYARWRGKRLPTPYEWCLAAFGPRGVDAPPAWFASYMADTKQTWARMRQAHKDKLTELVQSGMSYGSIAHMANVYSLPWLPLSEAGEAFGQWSKEVMREGIAHLSEAWKEPFYLQANGSRPFDKSVYGVQDMVLNGAELVVPSPAPPYSGKDLTMSVTWIWDQLENTPNSSIGRRGASQPVEGYPFMFIEDPLIPQGMRLSHIFVPTILSRLFYIPFDTSSDLDKQLIYMNIYETADRLMPLVDWDLDMIQAGKYIHPPMNKLEFNFKDPMLSDPDQARLRPSDPVLKRLWKPQPSEFHIELGRPLPIPPNVTAPQPPDATYFLFLTGFRCAR
ncbi:MAG TPA: SUMF1/EgtB/PvdO family nonheme iron enzyme [Chthonomonadaceae bacterium]|nr:SUMF1/EgtB/PvdO family nonheme iron enzyme [Chthonomonadaceae bacterium]